MEEDGNLKLRTTGIISLKKNQGTKSGVPDLTGEVHQLPCCIKYDGPSDVSDYFKPKSTGLEVDGLAEQQAYFRGRKLHGVTIPIPPGYSGFVLGKKSLGKRKASDCNSNCWEPSAKFENITYWNHDTLPSQDDTFVRSLHWLSVAEAAGSFSSQPIEVVEHFHLMCGKLSDVKSVANAEISPRQSGYIKV